jgi:hypothetical protein
MTYIKIRVVCATSRIGQDLPSVFLRPVEPLWSYIGNLSLPDSKLSTERRPLTNLRKGRRVTDITPEDIRIVFVEQSFHLRLHHILHEVVDLNVSRIRL